MLSVHSVLNENCPSGHRWKSFASYPQFCESDEQDTIIHIMIYLKSNPLQFHCWYLNYTTIKHVLARLFLQIFFTVFFKHCTPHFTLDMPSSYSLVFSKHSFLSSFPSISINHQGLICSIQSDTCITFLSRSSSLPELSVSLQGNSSITSLIHY